MTPAPYSEDRRKTSGKRILTRKSSGKDLLHYTKVKLRRKMSENSLMKPSGNDKLKLGDI